MMKQSFNSILCAFFFLGALSIAGLPSVVFAEKPTPHGSVKKISHEDFCTSVDQLRAKVLSEIITNEMHYATKQNEKQALLDKRFAEREVALAAEKTTWDSKRDMLYKTLAGRAKTGAQKSAITKFKKAVDDATNLRRTRVKEAVKGFQGRMHAMSHERQVGTNAAILDLKGSVSNTLANAMRECDEGVAPARVRTTYTQNMKQSKDNFRRAIDTIEKKQESLRTLPLEEQRRIVSAVTLFKSELATAHNDLVRAFQ